MRVDANTRGHLQWYYFKMHNIKKGEVYLLNIVNFQKAKTLYTRGMRPYIYSYAAAEHRGSGWTQGGDDIEYSKKRSKLSCHLLGRQDLEDDKHYTLSFKVSADYPEDTLEIAYCPPYTFTKLSTFIKSTVSLHKDRDIIIDDHLCCSLGGFKVPLLTLTSEARRTEAEFKEDRMVKHKGLIFCMARIHPGESNGSYVMEGFINWLCGYSQEAQELRNKYLFKIVPMVNPDGVSIGNYRTGLSGRDFNR